MVKFLLDNIHLFLPKNKNKNHILPLRPNIATSKTSQTCLLSCLFCGAFFVFVPHCCCELWWLAVHVSITWVQWATAAEEVVIRAHYLRHYTHANDHQDSINWTLKQIQIKIQSKWWHQSQKSFSVKQVFWRLFGWTRNNACVH